MIVVGSLAQVRLSKILMQATFSNVPSCKAITVTVIVRVAPGAISGLSVQARTPPLTAPQEPPWTLVPTTLMPGGSVSVTRTGSVNSFRRRCRSFVTRIV